MIRLLAASCLWLALCLPAGAQQPMPPETTRLYELLRMDEVLEIMREEGIRYGESLSGDLFPGREGGSWSRALDRVYALDAMRRITRETFAEEMEGVDTGPLLDFFGSDEGRRVLRLEVDARRAMMDPGVEEAARERLAEMEMEPNRRLELIDEFVQANELLEMNVVSALNSNLAFYTGLLDGGAFEGRMTEQDALREVWAQEPQIRAETGEWVRAYLAMAYQPISDALLEEYIALSRTPAGQGLNVALFATFDRLFEHLNRQLGLQAAQEMAGSDI